ncbi:hypothetical protein QBC39DRAFT_303603 [Podospora conica]|nr:hypothetical protein QBC39DRAFT_303603 [Schizothecium conicum]
MPPPLRHLHLPSRSPTLFPPYRLASRLQNHLRRLQLDFKDSPSTSPPPPPALLTFTPPPTYTLGRRQHPSDLNINIPRLLAPLSLPSGIPLPPVSVLAAPRGGLATYHGPGQIVLWPVVDLRSPVHLHFTVRCWARALEDTSVAVLRGLGVEGLVVEGENPGVWVRDDARGGGGMRKIAALGVHLRRHVSGLGMAVNVDMPGTEEEEGGVGEEGNPWRRFVACGVEGRGVTSVRGEGGRVVPGEVVARRWAGELAGRIGVEGVEAVGREEVVGVLEGVLEGDGGEEGPVGEEERGYVAALRAGEV